MIWLNSEFPIYTFNGIIYFIIFISFIEHFTKEQLTAKKNLQSMLL